MQNIDTLLASDQKVVPGNHFVSKANIHSKTVLEEARKRAATHGEAYWKQEAENVVWGKFPHVICEGGAQSTKWFVDGTLNASVQCLDKHMHTDVYEKPAIIFETEDEKVETWTYRKLHDEVCRVSTGLKKLGVKKGDVVTIYMPSSPEAVATMLACARLGVIHSVVFAGFSSQAIADRMQDSSSKIIITATYTYRKGLRLDLRGTVLTALQLLGTEVKMITWMRDEKISLGSEEYDFKNLAVGLEMDRSYELMNSEDPLFILYTSGSTGKPKGLVHSTGGYLVGVQHSVKWVFDLKPQDIYWCTADIGWITGHSYVVYGMLSQGVTLFIYEGNLLFPNNERAWSLIQKHQVSIFYTAPTAIRTWMALGNRDNSSYDLSSLRLLGSVGEPINPEAWNWYYENVGSSKCPVIDTWWQTETGAIMISGVPGIQDMKPGSATMPLPGMEIDVIDHQGNTCSPHVGGNLVIKKPWPSMARTILNNSDRFFETYWSQFPGYYFTGDGAHRDSDGYFWIKGRIDDVLNVSGHRLGTMEIESLLVNHPSVAEAAVVGRTHEVKGQAVCAYVVLRKNVDTSDIVTKLKDHIVRQIGSLARPDDIFIEDKLPKTRSGKIMRRILRDRANGKEISGDLTTLES